MFGTSKYLTCCEKCDGLGLVFSRPWERWWDESRLLWKFGKPVPPTPEEPEEIVCPACGGSSVQETEEGRQLREYLAFHEWSCAGSKV